MTVSKDNVDIRPAKGIRYLFTTKTCPNCQIAKEALADLKYKLIDAEENPEAGAQVWHYAGTYPGDRQ